MYSFKNAHALFEAIYALAFYIACNLLGVMQVLAFFLSAQIQLLTQPLIIQFGCEKAQPCRQSLVSIIPCIVQCMHACLDCFQGKRTVHFNVSIDLIATQKLHFLGYQYIQYIQIYILMCLLVHWEMKEITNIRWCMMMYIQI